MKNQALIDIKRSSERRYSNADLKDKNVAYRLMRTCGLAVCDFEKLFPGESYFEIKNLRRNRAKLRAKINAS
ncbi:MAG: hypothetical protein Q4A21_01805 [bacterium]|nr:hypothetical protein [bacterium]